MSRVTQSQLQSLVDELNRATGSPMTPWTRDADDNLRANIGNYHLSGAYGGVCLHRMFNDGGGVTTPLGLGHRPKRELYDELHAYLRSIQAGKELA